MTAPKLSAANWITIALVAAGVVSSFAVAQYQIGTMEKRIVAMNRDATERVTKFEMIASFAATLGLSGEDVDSLFIAAAQIHA